MTHSLNRRLWIFETTQGGLLKAVCKEVWPVHGVGLSTPEPAGLADGELSVIGDV